LCSFETFFFFAHVLLQYHLDVFFLSNQYILVLLFNPSTYLRFFSLLFFLLCFVALFVWKLNRFFEYSHSFQSLFLSLPLFPAPLR